MNRLLPTIVPAVYMTPKQFLWAAEGAGITVYGPAPLGSLQRWASLYVRFNKVGPR